MKTWEAPKIEVETSVTNEFVTACVQYTADGNCGVGIDHFESHTKQYDIIDLTINPRVDPNHDG